MLSLADGEDVSPLALVTADWDPVAVIEPLSLTVSAVFVESVALPVFVPAEPEAFFSGSSTVVVSVDFSSLTSVTSCIDVPLLFCESESPLLQPA